MIYFVLTVLYLLMLSLGMSLRLTEVAARWRSMTFQTWTAISFATFVIPPAAALIFSRLFRLTPAETAGFFMVGVAPGAPLLTRNLAKKGFDPIIAASYQLWASIMIPAVVPILVFIAGKLYDRDIWISPQSLVPFVATRQLFPLALGMLLGWVWPNFCQRVQPALNRLGNAGLIFAVAVILYKIGPAIRDATPFVPVVALLLAITAIVAVRLYPLSDRPVREAFALCNVNRNVGLALLLTVKYLKISDALPALTCYVLIAPIIMLLYDKLFRPLRKSYVGAHA